MSGDYSTLDIKDMGDEVRRAQSDLNVLSDAPLLSEDTLEFLLRFEKAYESNSLPHYEDENKTAYYARNTARWHNVVRKEKSRELRKAVRNGNHELVAYALGRGTQEENVKMDFGDYEKHRSLLQEPGLVELLYAGMGGGKTMTAVRQAEVWMMLYPSGKVITNIQSWSEEHPRVEYAGSLPELVQAATETSDQRVFAVLDEFGIKASAYGGASQDAMEAVMKNLVRLMRKEPYRMQLVGISQRPTDIHPTLRNDEIATYGFKEGNSKSEKQKHLVIYDGTEDKNCTTPDDDQKIVDIRGIGMPETPPDTNDQAEWDWGDPEEWVELGLTSWEELDMNPDDQDGGSDPDQCAFVKDNDEQCGSLVWDEHESGMCTTHRHMQD